jgi:hypothetical protein
MDSNHPIQTETAPRASGFRKALLMISIAFLIGLGVMGWAVTRWEPARRLFLGASSGTATDVGARLDEASAPPPATIAPQPVTVTPGGDRVSALEDKLEKIDENADAASGNAGRAEGLLIAFAARRAIERGLALGYLEGALEQRFGKAQPRAVGIIIAASRQPVTTDALKQELDTLAPTLVGGGPDESWWTGFRRELSGLIIVRKSGTPSPDPVARLERAKGLIDAGRVDAALAEVARLPGAPRAEKWMADARRLVEAYRALDLLEASAIMLPQRAARIAPPPAPEAPKADEEQAPPAGNSV